MILAVVLYWHETWYLTLREVHRLSENRVLRRIFGPAESWRRLHDEELRNLHISSYIINVTKSRRVGWAEHIARMGDINSYRILVGKPEGKRPLGRLRRRWEGNIRM
jgi:hypothetical protein